MTATHRRIPSSTANHNHRQRKKLHIGEYKEMALILRIGFKPEMSEREHDVFADRFITEVLDERALVGLGVISESFSILNLEGTVTQEDVDVIQHWLKQQPEVLGAVGEIDDAWYS